MKLTITIENTKEATKTLIYRAEIEDAEIIDALFAGNNNVSVKLKRGLNSINKELEHNNKRIQYMQKRLFSINSMIQTLNHEVFQSQIFLTGEIKRIAVLCANNEFDKLKAMLDQNQYLSIFEENKHKLAALERERKEIQELLDKYNDDNN